MSGVRVVDYGISGMHLAYDLLEQWDALVLVDAMPNRGSPGTLHVFEADHETLSPTAGLEAHSMDPAAVFATLTALGGAPPHTIVIGCEVGTSTRAWVCPSRGRRRARAVDAVTDVIAGLRTRSPAASVEGRG